MAGKPISTSGKRAGDTHPPRSTPSRKHSNSASKYGSVVVNAKAVVSVWATTPLGPATIAVSGAFATSKPNSAGISPAMPYSLTARTSNRYSPSGRFRYVCGVEHASKRFWKNGFGVSRHSKVALGSLEENVNVCSGPGLGSGGVSSIVGSSGGVTTRQV